MADRDTVTVTLFHGSSDICYSLPDAVAWLTELLEDVPEGHHESSRFEIELDRGWYDDGASMSIRVYYTRPETDEEVAARVAENEANAAAARRYNEQREREIYEQLRRKFG